MTDSKYREKEQASNTVRNSWVKAEFQNTTYPFEERMIKLMYNVVHVTVQTDNDTHPSHVKTLAMTNVACFCCVD